MPYVELVSEDGKSKIAFNTDYVICVGESQRGNACIYTTRCTFYTATEYKDALEKIKAATNSAKTR